MKPPRFLELDALRGIAVVAMVVFHFLFDYNFFIAPRFDLYVGLWFWMGRLSAFLFVFLFGVALYLRVHRRKLAGPKLVRDLAGHGVLLFALGLIITVFTLLFFPVYTVWFGVLHLLGVSAVIAIAFVTRPRLAGAIGIITTAIGLLLSMGVLSVELPLRVPLLPAWFATFDYFPLFPWLGIMLLGIFAASLGYRQGLRRFSFPFSPRFSLCWQKSAWLGRYSLWIYFVHQPVLVALLWFLMVLLNI